ncbi:MAG: hypothetical protein IJ740_08535 [Ruminococcus sp.]|nr:hypothetical protein [Ruminococcus sp.]
MTDKEYQMTFGEWCNTTKGTSLKLTQFGEIDYTDQNKFVVTEQFHDLWEAERKEYRLREKNRKITNALENLKAEGVECVLSSYQSGHIKAKSKHGVIYSYYATTGTIAGYYGTNICGLDEFIKLCKE